MKGYCPRCKKEVDEVVFSQFKMCIKCFIKNIKEIKV